MRRGPRAELGHLPSVVGPTRVELRQSVSMQAQDRRAARDHADAAGLSESRPLRCRRSCRRSGWDRPPAQRRDPVLRRRARARPRRQALLCGRRAFATGAVERMVAIGSRGRGACREVLGLARSWGGSSSCSDRAADPGPKPGASCDEEAMERAREALGLRPQHVRVGRTTTSAARSHRCTWLPRGATTAAEWRAPRALGAPRGRSRRRNGGRGARALARRRSDAGLTSSARSWGSPRGACAGDPAALPRSRGS